MKESRPEIRGQSGLSIVSLMIGLGITASIVMAVSSYFSQAAELSRAHAARSASETMLTLVGKELRERVMKRSSVHGAPPKVYACNPKVKDAKCIETESIQRLADNKYKTSRYQFYNGCIDVAANHPLKESGHNEWKALRAKLSSICATSCSENQLPIVHVKMWEDVSDPKKFFIRRFPGDGTTQSSGAIASQVCVVRQTKINLNVEFVALYLSRNRQPDLVHQSEVIPLRIGGQRVQWMVH